VHTHVLLSTISCSCRDVQTSKSGDDLCQAMPATHEPAVMAWVSKFIMAQVTGHWHADSGQPEQQSYSKLPTPMKNALIKFHTALGLCKGNLTINANIA
jgi:hypothetical protein